MCVRRDKNSGEIEYTGVGEGSVWTETHHLCSLHFGFLSPLVELMALGFLQTEMERIVKGV
jgi:hypothetical protein